MKAKQKLITDKKQLLFSLGEKKCLCGEDRFEMLTVDHIIPMFILKDFGLTLEQMYEKKFLKILCRKCNSMKANHLDLTDSRTKELLYDLLENY